jgi:hypothetical protein
LGGRQGQSTRPPTEAAYRFLFSGRLCDRAKQLSCTCQVPSRDLTKPYSLAATAGLPKISGWCAGLTPLSCTAPQTRRARRAGRRHPSRSQKRRRKHRWRCLARLQAKHSDHHIFPRLDDIVGRARRISAECRSSIDVCLNRTGRLSNHHVGLIALVEHHKMAAARRYRCFCGFNRTKSSTRAAAV